MKSKKVLVLSSTPRRGGNSDLLCDEFIRGAREKGHEIEKIFLKDKRIAYCLGCGACSERGVPCPQKDDMAEVLEKMIAADVIVMASPVYFYSISAQMKTLIDRCCSRYTEIKGKEFYFIMTMADTVQSNMERTMECFRAFLDCLEDPREAGSVWALGVWKLNEIRSTPYMEEAYQLGKTV